MNHSWTPLRAQMDVNDLRALLEFLTKDFRFVTIGDAVDMIRGDSPIIENAAVLTFDDGYRNNFTHALPILEEFGVPGAFYIATGLVENREPFWFDRLDYLLQTAAKDGVAFQIADRKFELRSNDRSEVAALYASLRKHCKRHFSDDRDFTNALTALAESLERKIGEPAKYVLNSDEWAAVVSPEEIGEYAKKQLVTLGGHTVSHLRLSFSEDSEIVRELSDSKDSIEAWSRRACVDFAYPNGAYNATCAALVAKTGYRSAVTMEYGFAEMGDDPFTLRRLSLPSDYRRSEILARASGLVGVGGPA